MLAAAAAMILLLSACGDDNATSDEVQDIVDDLIDFPTPVSSVRVCTGGVMLNQTLIPNDSTGTLFGSLEAWGPDGTIVGMYGQAANTPGTPVIDYTADSYTISTMFTNDGSTEITCEAALT